MINAIVFLDIMLPVAPSVNRSLRPGSVVKQNGRKAHRLVHTGSFKSWYNSVGYLVNSELQRADYPTPSKNIRYHVSIFANVGYVRDIDNILKPTLDLLKKCGAIFDDRYVDAIQLERQNTGHACPMPGDMRVVVGWRDE